MPGVGKSTAAAWLAERLGWTYVDTDSIIRFNTDKSIADIFRESGEEAFRMHERNALFQTMELQRAVIATGGGTPCWFDNMERMNASGLTVYLQADLVELCRRLSVSGAGRPLFSSLNAGELSLKLYEMQEARAVFYAQSKLVLPPGWTNDSLYSVVSQLVSERD
jgi:shikimate kinase